MESLRYLRITEIAKMSLEDAQNSLSFSKSKLQQLNNVDFASNVPTDIFLESHLTADDIWFLENRITTLLDEQLDDYQAQRNTRPWSKQDACKLLRAALNK